MKEPAAEATSLLHRIYRSSLGLLTDLYQLTMAYGYWKTGANRKDAVFHLFFRRNPFEGGFTVAAGLDFVCDYIRDFKFSGDDLEYLASLKGSDKKPLFDRAFLGYLEDLRLSCDIDAIPEGTVVFPQEPLVRVKGSLLECQLLETSLLNLVNFQTLIATKAARICMATEGEPVLEFGLRRAQGIDGGLSASRASYLGGCAGTSNLLAGKLFGIPVRGTHAHSWVMSFGDELEAFLAYAAAMPNNCIFLVDTYDTLQGVRRAVEAGKWLRQRGHDMLGVRLDSGDLAQLSIEARKILDAAGFPDAVIVGSNNLDEHIISSLKDQNSAINVWGVGTRLATSFDQPAIGGVYKLSAIRSPGRKWEYRLKLSEQVIKVNNPGIMQVRRYQMGPQFSADVIYDEVMGIGETCTLVDPLDPTRRLTLEAGAPFTELLQPVFRGGVQIADSPSLEASRERLKGQIRQLPSGVKRFLNPAFYPVGLEKSLHDLKTRLVLEARGTKGS